MGWRLMVDEGGVVRCWGICRDWGERGWSFKVRPSEGRPPGEMDQTGDGKGDGPAVSV